MVGGWEHVTHGGGCLAADCGLMGVGLPLDRMHIYYTNLCSSVV